jgi:hypothetical protein
MGAIIDTGNPFIPFIGGIIVGGLIVPPIMGAAGGLFDQAFGQEADAAYSYHGFMHKHGGRWPHHKRRHGMHKHMMHGIMHPSIPHMPLKTIARHRDFEKEYNNVEQTYTNHINVRH